jgi:hypothetical protein
MHSVLEGAIKNLFKFWFSPEHSSKPYSLRGFMQNIDERLTKITPPQFVAATPRSIYDWNLWRAHEFLGFILYYALPVFVNIMEYEYISNLSKLVVFLEIILARSIDPKILKKAQIIIEDYVQELEDLYHPTIMLSGVHELLHLTECIFIFGHLNSINLFVFEENNRKIISFINGHDLIGEELMKIFSIAQTLSSYVVNITGRIFFTKINFYFNFNYHL